jgi:predicted AlkP superfamily pyrophosphatase or phosphodiesterase
LRASPDLELEAIYQDQVRSFVDYQTRIALRAIAQNPTADLVMTYIEQPDGSGHQFLITDPHQATDPKDPNSIGPNQDRAKIRRYRDYLRRAYQVVDQAVQRIIEAAGQEFNGRLLRNVIVVSDHGFTPFHTAVSINNLFAREGLDPNKVRAVTSGPAVNVYINRYEQTVSTAPNAHPLGVESHPGCRASRVEGSGEPVRYLPSGARIKRVRTIFGSRTKLSAPEGSIPMYKV